MRKENGITLVALIITIILMLILAGVVLSLTIGENGVFKMAKYSVQKNSEEEAKEKLELALADLTTYKYTDEAYNENEYINSYLEDKNMEVLGDIVTIDNWNFEIDRSIPSIKTSLGASTVKLTKEVKEYLGKNENDKYMVSVLVKIESNIKIESIEFENIDGTILIVTTENQTLAKDMQIELDKEYKITVKLANGKTQTKTIIERSVENIRTVEELVAFRDKVNTGLTYEGKTINLLADLDLSSICGENVNGQEVSWEPIGNGTDDTHIFKGIFDGKGHKIDNLYINTTNSYQGLFGYAKSGEIKNINIKSGNINGYYMVGSLAGGISGVTLSRVGNEVNVNATNNMAGGIVGTMDEKSTILQCYNKGNISANWNIDYKGAGGIVGQVANGEIVDSYNIGSVISSWYSGGIAGMVVKMTKITNCYNAGNISGKKNERKGGIVGAVNSEGGYLNLNNNYWKNNCGVVYGVGELMSNSGAIPLNETDIKKSEEKLGKAYSEDIVIKVIDETTGEEKEIWKYNNGYPVLKWQLENN